MSAESQAREQLVQAMEHQLVLKATELVPIERRNRDGVGLCIEALERAAVFLRTTRKKVDELYKPTGRSW